MPTADCVFVDGSNLAHRAWYGSGATPYAASVTFTTMVRSLVRVHSARYAAVAFDSPSCFRFEKWPFYKSGRQPRNPEVKEWVSSLREVEEIGGVKVVVSPRHEADDCLAALTAVAQRLRQTEEPPRVLLVTSDTDAYALVRPQVNIALPSSGAGCRYLGPAEVEAKLGVPPWHVLAYKALAGDQGDSVPGVPGIGPLKAKVLLKECRQYRNREALLAALDCLESSPFKLTREQAEPVALDCYECLRPRVDAPLSREFADLAVKP